MLFLPIPTPEERERQKRWNKRHPREPFDPDPVLIDLIRKSMPNLLSYEICPVQPLCEPSGLMYTLGKPDYRQRIKENIAKMRASGYSWKLSNANSREKIRGQQLDISKQVNSIEFTGKDI